MLEKNKEQFPGFAGDGIKSKIHEFEGAHYYSVPPKYVFFDFLLFTGVYANFLLLWSFCRYVHYLIGSMEENLIRKGGFSTDGDITIEITPLSPVRHPFSSLFCHFRGFW